ncbi:MAG: T9SS type A sorting domain-containing protein [Flavobacteriales bacterium]|nr:T9SS type A sorting domain-containing protein [Flavobacteriales bacterium]
MAHFAPNSTRSVKDLFGHASRSLLLLAFAFLLLPGSMLAQLTGTKTIGIDYVSITTAVTDLNAQGVGAGGVVFDVPAGYTETLTGRITVTATGTLANPITFQKSGVGANPVLTSYTGTVSTPSVIADGMFVLAGSDYVTIDGIDLLENPANTTTTTQMEFGYGLLKTSATNGCQNNIIRNCSISLSNLNYTLWTAPGHYGSTGIIVLNSLHNATGTLTVTAPSGSNSNNQLRANTIRNCNAGIVFSGFAAASGGPAPDPGTFLGDLNNDIGGTAPATGNAILNFGGAAGATTPASGIFANYQWGLNVSRNTINNNDGGGTNHVNVLKAILLNSSSTSASVSCNNNTITLHGGGTTSQVTGIENAFGATPTGNTVNLNNNTITGDYLTATSGAFYGIYSTSTASVVSLAGNDISDITYSSSGLTGSGSMYLIYCTGSNAAMTYTIDNNTVDNISRTGTSGGTTIGVYLSSGSTGQAVNVTGNTVSNLSIDGAGTTSTMYGIQISTGTVLVSDNTITNLQCLKTTGSSTMYGIYNISSPVDETYNNNQINNLLHNGTGTVYGIYTYTTTGVRTVSGNTVHTLRTGGTTISGIQQTTSSPTITRNRIYDIESTSTGSPTVTGLMITSASVGGVHVSNNYIGDLRAPNATTSSPLTLPTIRGINLTTTSTGDVNLSYNTVHLGATSSGTNFSTTALYATTSATATAATLNLRDNILSNVSVPNGTGYTAAYWRSSTTLTNFGAASNNNFFSGGNPGPNNLIFRDGTNSDQNLGDYQTRVTARDAASITGSVNFLSTTGGDPTWLHIDPAIATFLESGGIPIAGITTDYDNDTRDPSTPDVGADEFAGTQPAVCTGTPASSNITGDAEACVDQSTDLALDVIYSDQQITYQWRASTTLGGPYTITLGTNAGQATGAQPVDMYYICEITCNNGGPFTYTTSEHSITAKPVPSASADAGVACLGQILQLDGTTDIGTVFSWSGPNSFTSGIEDPTVDPVVIASAGTYSFTATLNGCASPVATTLVSTVTPPSITSVTATPNPVCIGDDSQLLATAAAPGYSMGAGGSSFIDISGTGTVVAGAVSDDSEHNITFPAFVFNGVSYTDGRVGANGAMVLGVTTGEVYFGNAALPSTANTAGNVFIAPFWDDLDALTAGGSNIFTQQVGNLFIIQWDDIAHLSDAPGQTITFQIQLDLVTGKIYFAYQDVFFGGTQTAYDQGLNATVGIQWAASAGNFVQYSFNTASLSDGQVISFTPNTPSFSWSPNTYLTADNIPNPLAQNVLADETYTLEVTAGGCSSTQNLLLEANPAILPAEADITPASPEYCTGGDVTLTANPLGGGGPYVFTWTPPGGSPTLGTETQSANLPGLWSVQIDDACGGAAFANITVVENPKPTASATVSSACEGDDLVFDGTTDIGTGFAWSGPNAYTSAVEDPTITGAAITDGGTYTFVATLGPCSSVPYLVVATVDAVPVITSITATPNPVCSGTDSQLNVLSPAGYSMGGGGSSFIDISGTGTAVTPVAGDDSEHNVTIPGGFVFNGMSYTDLRIGSNGVAVFGSTTGDVSLGNVALPSTAHTAGNVFLAPFWDDMDEGPATPTGNIYTQVSGNLFIVQWQTYGHYSATSGQNITFQIQLDLVTDVIYFAYQDVFFGGTQTAYDQGLSATVGIQWAASAGNFLQYSFNTASLSDGQVISFTPNSLTYAWTPNTYLDFDDVADPIAQNPNATTPYSVLVTGTNGCTATGNVTLTVNQVPDVDLAVVPSCGTNQFSISVLVNSTGSGPTVNLSYTVDGGTPVVVSGLGTGPQTPLGPFGALADVRVTVIDPVGGCNLTEERFLSECPEEFACPTVLNKTYCYGNSDQRTWLFTTTTPSELALLTFVSGAMAPGDVLRIYDGVDNTGASLVSGNFADLTGVQALASGPSLFMEVDSDPSGSCADGDPLASVWNWEVKCNPPCTNPAGNVVPTPDCLDQTFSLDVGVDFVGDGAFVKVRYSVNAGTPVTLPGNYVDFDVVNIGPFNLGDVVNVRLLHENNGACNLNLGDWNLDLAACPNDEPCSAHILTMNPNYTCVTTNAGDMTGATLTAGVTGGCAGVQQDQWYRFTATATTHRVQLGGTTTGLSHSIYVGDPDCNTLLLVAGTACTAGATASNPAGLSLGQTYYVRVSRTTIGTNAYTVCVSAPPAIDMRATALALPSATGCYSAAEPVSITVQNNTIYPIDFSVDPVTVTTNVTGVAPAGLSGTLNTGVLAPGATTDVPMSTTLDMSTAGTYTFNAYTTVAGDGIPANDAMTAAARTVVAPRALPITQNFTGFSGANLLTLVAPNNGWREATGALVPGAGTTSTWASSVTAQQTQLGSGVSARINLVGTSRNEWLLGPKFVPILGTVLRYRVAITDLSTGAADPLGMGPTDDRVRVMISTDCGVTYSELFAHNSSNSASLANSLVQQQIDLGAYAGDEVIIGFLAQDGPIDDLASYDFHVDDISIENIAVCTGAPVAGTSVSSVPGPVCAPASTTLSVSGQSTDGGVAVSWWGSTVSGGPYTIPQGSGTTLGVSGLEAAQYWVASVKCLLTSDSTLTNEVSIQVTPTPSANATAGDACMDEDLDFWGITNFGTTFGWTGPGGFSSPAQNPVRPAIDGTAAGTYTFTATANGCPRSSQVVVSVNTTPVITSLTASPNPVCVGGTSLLNVTAPVAGYVMGAGGSSFIDISGTGTPVPSVPDVLGDDSEHAITIPGAGFDYNGVNYTSALVGNNGAMVFGVSTGTITFSNAVLGTTTFGGAGSVGLAPFWDDLDILTAGGSNIFTEQAGNLFIIQWDNTAHLSDAPGQTITFQIQLDLVTGAIYFAYQDVFFGGTQTAYDQGLSATVGIQWDASGTGLLQYSFNTASLSDGQVISFTPNQASFLWTPNTYLDFDNIADPMASNVLADETYSVTATAAGCTSAPSQLLLEANPPILPTEAEVTPDPASFCTGSDVTLTAVPLGGGGPYTFTWTDPNLVVGTPSASPTVQANIPGTWSVLIEDGCNSQANASVFVTEYPVPLASATSNSPLCVGLDLELDGGSDVGGSAFEWSGPGGYTSSIEDPTRTSVTLNMSGSYSVVATANGCSSIPAATIVDIGMSPIGVTASSSAAVVCAPGGTVDLMSTGAGGPPTILSEDFNGAMTGWTTGNMTTTTGTGNIALTAWTLRPDGFAGDLGVQHSNDNSQFISSSSDDGGSGGMTNTTLTSPPFSLAGYSSASLSFWQDYQNLVAGESASVEISTDGGGIWATLISYNTDQGTWAAWVNANLSLNAYLNEASVQVRFHYNTPGWDWYWAVDNVLITGVPIPVTFSWSSDPLGYSSGVQNPMGAPLTQTTVFTVTASSPQGCETTADVTVYYGNNDLTLEFGTDNDASTEVSWELHMQGTGQLLQSGAGLPDNANAATVFSCLPDGCFYLRVLDSGNDGITGGGYILRESAGSQRRIIDNRNNFTTGGVSAIANDGEFCLPLGPDRLIYTSCDKLDWKTSPCGGEYVVADDNDDVTATYPNGGNDLDLSNDGYQMWWYDPNGGYSFRRFQSHLTNNGFPASATRACHFKLNNWLGNQMAQGVLYNVKVRSRVDGNWSAWGAACRLMIDDAAAQCPRTKLMDIPDNPYLSCGQTFPIGTSAASRVFAHPVRRMNNNCNWVSANRYQFRFRIPAELIDITKTSAVGQYWVNVNAPLTCGKTYEVDVRASFNSGATWCSVSDPYGDVCLLTTANCFQEGGNQNMVSDNATNLRMYPNPNRGDQLYLSLDAVDEGVETVSVDMYDTFGKRVSARTIAVQDGFINTVLELNGDLSGGMYMVNITAGGKTYTQRLVIQP